MLSVRRAALLSRERVPDSVAGNMKQPKPAAMVLEAIKHVRETVDQNPRDTLDSDDVHMLCDELEIRLHAPFPEERARRAEADRDEANDYASERGNVIMQIEGVIMDSGVVTGDLPAAVRALVAERDEARAALRRSVRAHERVGSPEAKAAAFVEFDRAAAAAAALVATWKAPSRRVASRRKAPT